MEKGPWQSYLIAKMRRAFWLPALQTPMPHEASSAAHLLPARQIPPVHLAVQGPVFWLRLLAWSLRATLCHLKKDCPLRVVLNLPLVAESALPGPGTGLMPIPRVSRGGLPVAWYHG